MKKDLPVAPQPDPENSLIRALRMSAAHLYKVADGLRPRHPVSARMTCDAAAECEMAARMESERMRATGEASS